MKEIGPILLFVYIIIIIIIMIEPCNVGIGQFENFLFTLTLVSVTDIFLG